MPQERSEIVALQELTLAIEAIKEIEDIQLKIQGLNATFNRLINNFMGHIEVAKELRYGGESWLVEAINSQESQAFRENSEQQQEVKAKARAIWDYYERLRPKMAE